MSVNFFVILAASSLAATHAPEAIRSSQALPNTHAAQNSSAGKNHPVGTEWAYEKFLHSASHNVDLPVRPNPHACGAHGVAISAC